MGKGDRRGKAPNVKIELPGIAPVKRRVKQGRQRMREIQKEHEAEAHANLRAIYAARAALPKWAKQAPTDREVSK